MYITNTAIDLHHHTLITLLYYIVLHCTAWSATWCGWWCCISAAGYHRDGYLTPGEPFIPPLTSLSHRSMFSEHPASLGSGSITIPGSLDGR